MEVNVLLLFTPDCNPNSSPKPKCLTTGPVGRWSVTHSSVSLGACLSSLAELSADCQGWSPG